METKFNFKSAICASREQSERLLALGLKKETADMVWSDHAMTEEYEDWKVTPVEEWDDWNEHDIPAWSLHRLWELANIKHIILDSQDEIAVLYDEVIMKIEQFIKDGCFNKEYLEE